MKNKEVTSFEERPEDFVLSIPKPRIGDFFDELVRNKRRISKAFPHAFSLIKEDVKDIYDTINYRVNEQNSALLSSCEVYVLYVDGSRRTYNSIDQFMGLDDGFSEVSHSLVMELVFLMKFPGGDVPQKQKISAAFFGNRLRNIKDSIFRLTGEGSIVLEIETNSFTWADDIVNYFEGKLDSKYEKPGAFKNIFLATCNYAPIVLMFGLFASLMITPLTSIYRASHLPFSEFASSLAGREPSVELISQKLDFIIENSRTIASSSSVYQSLSVMVLSILVFSLLVIGRYLFMERAVCVNQISINSNRRSQRIKRWIKSSLIMGCILAIGSSFFASFLWEKLRF